MLPLACWESGFETAGAGMAIDFECFVCQVEVSAAGRSLVQRSPTEYVRMCRYDQA